MSYQLWSDEYDAIQEDMEKNGNTKENARRILIWIEGFMWKTLTDTTRTEEEVKIIAEIRRKNLENIKKHGDVL